MGRDIQATSLTVSALRSRLGTPKHTFSAARGELLVWVPAPGHVVVNAGWGHGGMELVGPLLAAFDAAIAEGATEIWGDWRGFTSYDSQTRVLMTKWTRARPAIIGDIHVLVASRLMAMGVTVANLALGNAFEVTSDAVAFERKLLAKL